MENPTYVTIIKQRIIETLFIASFIIEVDISLVYTICAHISSLNNMCFRLKDTFATQQCTHWKLAKYDEMPQVLYATYSF